MDGLRLSSAGRAYGHAKHFFNIDYIVHKDEFKIKAGIGSAGDGQAVHRTCI